jgi:hypothetical protein
MQPRVRVLILTPFNSTKLIRKKVKLTPSMCATVHLINLPITTGQLGNIYCMHSIIVINLFLQLNANDIYVKINVDKSATSFF